MISDFLKTRAKLTPDKIALKEYIGEKSRSFSQLEKNAHKLAASMKSIGVAKGDRIGALCRNRIEFFETLFACAKLGAILVPFNWRSPPDEILPLYETIASKILFYGDEDAQNALQIVGANC
ncbi:MAG: acyl--CoA ligase, partial [Caulobacterales bacterium]|nr:acyl--CoA ligase [Caulobacterales bacterium]